MRHAKENHLMRRILLILFTLFTISGTAQKVSEDYVDEFTKNHIKRTDWETLTFDMKGVTHYRLSKIDDHYFIQLKIMLGDVFFSINENDEFMLKLANDEIVTLKNMKYTTTCVGCGSTGLNGSGAQGICVNYNINNEQYLLLTQNVVSKIRVYTSKGLIDLEIKNKKADILQKALKLIE